MRTSSILALLPLAALAACNDVTTGAHGVLTFTPDECGQDFCSLEDDDLVAGGTMRVMVEGVSDENGNSPDVFNLQVISSDPNVFRVEAVSYSSFGSELEVIGVGPGYARLVAIDANGHEIDYTGITVHLADALAIERHLGDAVGPTTRLGYDQVWTVNADQAVELRAVPMHAGWRLMGRVAYHVDIDSVLFDGLAPGSDLERGELEFRVPMGEYPVSFQAPDGTTLRLLIVAQ